MQGQIPVLDPRLVAQHAAAQAVAQVTFQSNLNTIANEYADIFNDRDLSLLAADRVGNLRGKYLSLGLPKTDLDLYREACSDVWTKFGKKPEAVPVVKEETTPVQQVSSVVSPTRHERKRAAPQPVAAVNQSQGMLPQSSAPSGSDIVAAMRRSRGQPAA